MFLTPLITAPIDITIMLLGAFVIGYGIAWMLQKNRMEKLEDEESKLQAEIRNLHVLNEDLDISKDKLQNQLNECLESKKNLVSNEEIHRITLELKQERDRGETARQSLVEIERAHEALKQELQLKIDQMLSQEETNKLRAELNRLRVFNATLEDELRELKESQQTTTIESTSLNHSANELDTITDHDFVKSIGVKEAPSHQTDDLKQISGVGPFIEEKLNRLGIYTFEQIASLTAEQAEKINEAIEFFPGRIQRDDWVSQAKKFGEHGID
jgi:predicted flap endonuclease-1-like 5' DNA nuclease